MSALIVSANWPAPLDAFRHGIAQRMRLLFRAAFAVSGPLHLFFFHSHRFAPGPEDLAVLRNDFQRLGGIEVASIGTAPITPAKGSPTGLWSGYLRPMLSVRYQPSFEGLAGPSHATGLQRMVQACGARWILAHRLPVMLPLQQAAPAGLPVALDLDDIEHKAFARALALPPHWGAKRLMRLWVPALRRGERQAVRQAAGTLVCSETDAAELNRLYGVKTVHAVPNALPVPMAGPLPAQPTVLFLGIYSYRPNRVAAEELMERIWPLVQARVPQAQLLVAGRDAETLRQHGAPPPGVEILGFVDNLQALYDRVRVVACPIRSGGGTRIKIIEAAMQGRPVVSTRLGAEGLVFDSSRDEIALADETSEFADAVCRLLLDDQAARAMGAAARACAMRAYAESAVLGQTAGLLQAVAREPA